MNIKGALNYVYIYMQIWVSATCSPGHMHTQKHTYWVIYFFQASFFNTISIQYKHWKKVLITSNLTFGRKN